MPDATVLKVSPQEQKWASRLVERVESIYIATKEDCAQEHSTSELTSIYEESKRRVTIWYSI